jgi:hypothetical protein
MSFKQSTGLRFLPSADPFKGRGTKDSGLTHGGQYSVDYILDKSKGQPLRSRPSSVRASIADYLQDAPPVAAPRPSKEEQARLKNAAGNFQSVTGSRKEEIRESLKGFTCWKQAAPGYVENCNGLHAWYQVTEVGNCNAGADALDKLSKCADGSFSFGRCTNFRLEETGGRRRYLQEVAGQAAQDLTEAISECVAKSTTFSYGCTDERALNYNPKADGDDGSCEFAQESDQPDGDFSFDPLIDQLPPEYGGVSEIQPAPGVKTAGVQIKPVQLIAFLGLAAVIFFVANRPKAQS